MDKFLILIIMIFMHLFADFHVQGVLANMKQESWWRNSVLNYDKSQYKDDYKVALLVHSFEWAFIMMLPLLVGIYNMCWSFKYYSVISALSYLVLLACNTAMHYKVDNDKANMKTINLIMDQTIHLSQVLVTWAIFTAVTCEFFLYFWKDDCNAYWNGEADYQVSVQGCDGLCVLYEARLWFERNKVGYTLKEFGKIGKTYKI